MKLHVSTRDKCVIMTKVVHVVLLMMMLSMRMVSCGQSEHMTCTALCTPHTHARKDTERQFLCQISPSPEEQLDHGSRLGQFLAKTLFKQPECGVTFSQRPTEKTTQSAAHKGPVKCENPAPRENTYVFVSSSSSKIFHYKVGVISTYENMDQPDINSLSYSTCQNMIFAASSRNDIVVSFRLPSGGKMLVKDHIYIADITVDDTKQWLFYAQKKLSAIAVSYYDGSSFRIIRSLKGDSDSLVVEPKHELIYFCKSGKVLAQMTYWGTSYKELTSSVRISNLSQHHEKRLLYFIRDGRLTKRYSLEENQVDPKWKIPVRKNVTDIYISEEGQLYHILEGLKMISRFNTLRIEQLGQVKTQRTVTCFIEI